MKPGRGATFALGALLGSLLDAVHVRSGVLEYPRPFLGNLGWYAPLRMGLLALCAVLLQERVSARLGEVPESAVQRPVRASVWFAFAWLATGLYQAYPGALMLFLGSAFVARALLLPTGRSAWVLGALCALLGTCSERAWQGAGLVLYRNPDLFGVPLWLPALYAHGALLMLAWAPSRGAEPR